MTDSDDELVGRFQSGLCLRTREEVEHEIALVREQTRLVIRETQLIEEEQDDRAVHHGHSRRPAGPEGHRTDRRAPRLLTYATILQFKPRDQL